MIMYTDVMTIKVHAAGVGKCCLSNAGKRVRCQGV